MQNFQGLEAFRRGILEDARLFGDGYDFQIQLDSRFVLVEIKGLHSQNGAIRLTANEFLKAQEYKNDYGLVVVSNLGTLPKMTPIFNPISSLALKKHTITQEQISYHSASLTW